LTKPLRSLNTFNGGRHWASKNKHWREAPEWELWLRSTEGLGFVIPHGNKKRRVVVTRVLHGRERLWDDENLYGGSVKPLNDALVRLGWLRDDTPQWRELELRQVKATELSGHPCAELLKKTARTIVEIHELGER
jgi:hypothetical protein